MVSHSGSAHALSIATSKAPAPGNQIIFALCLIEFRCSYEYTGFPGAASCKFSCHFQITTNPTRTQRLRVKGTSGLRLVSHCVRPTWKVLFGRSVLVDATVCHTLRPCQTGRARSLVCACVCVLVCARRAASLARPGRTRPASPGLSAALSHPPPTPAQLLLIPSTAPSALTRAMQSRFRNRQRVLRPLHAARVMRRDPGTRPRALRQLRDAARTDLRAHVMRDAHEVNWVLRVVGGVG